MVLHRGEKKNKSAILPAHPRYALHAASLLSVSRSRHDREHEPAASHPRQAPLGPRQDRRARFSSHQDFEASPGVLEAEKKVF